MDFKTVIFDMDGTLIDSERFWQQSEMDVFGKLGVKVTPEHSLKTAGMTTNAVTHYWYNMHPWEGISIAEAENLVIDKVSRLILEYGELMTGAIDSLHYFKSRGYKMGLATNSPAKILNAVLSKFCWHKMFDCVLSVDDVEQGKPSPEIYIKAMQSLHSVPENSLAIEDSFSGLRSALSAGLPTIFVGQASPQVNTIANTSLTKIASLEDIDEALLKALAASQKVQNAKKPHRP